MPRKGHSRTLFTSDASPLSYAPESVPAVVTLPRVISCATTLCAPPSKSQNPSDSVGELHVVRGEVLSVAWKIENFISLSDRECRSPNFTFSGSPWQLELCNYNGSSTPSSWFVLYLISKNCDPSEIMKLEVGIKKAYDTLCIQEKFIRKFQGNTKYEITNFSEQSELLQPKEELTTLDDLTIIFKMKRLPPPTEQDTILTGLKDILATKKHSDVAIHVKDQAFEAHKVILAASSQVFSAMFEHEMSENDSGVVSIQDCEPESFQNFLNFLYTGRTDITDSNVYQLYSIAHKYCVEDLRALCVAFIINSLSVDNICHVVAHTYHYSDDDLIYSCDEFFKENIQHILPTSQWKALLKDHYLIAYNLLEFIAPKISVTD